MRALVHRWCALSACLLGFAIGTAYGQSHVSPVSPESAPVRIWGDVYMASLVQAWERGLQKEHPSVRFETHLMGTDTAMPGLYNGLADIALFGRESNQTEDDGFLHSLQYKPLQLQLTQGSLGVPNKSYAPAIFVSRQNPLAKLTLKQVRAIFGYGLGKPVRTWGDVGLTGAWKDKPVHAYTFDLGTGTGLFLLKRIQGESRKMNWEIVREFRDEGRPDGSVYEAGQQTMDALRRDPYGIAVSGLNYAERDVKPVALANAEDVEAVLPTRASVVDGSYPLARTTYAFVNQEPGKPVLPIVQEFLLFVYSDQGQALIESEGFLPLSKAAAQEQIRLLQ